MFMQVDLPEPDGPITATNSPSWTDRSMPASAATSASPDAVDLGHAAQLDERLLRH